MKKRKLLYSNKKCVMRVFKCFVAEEITQDPFWSSQTYVKNREIVEAAFESFKKLIYDLGEINGTQYHYWFSPFRRKKGVLRNIR